MRKALIYGLSLALAFSLSACTPTQEDPPEDTSTPEVTEPADTSEPEQTAPAEPDDQEPQETAETTADTEPTETPVAETPTQEEVTEPPAQQTSTPPQQAQSDTDSQTSQSKPSTGTSSGQQSSGSSGGQTQTQQPTTSGGNSYRDTAIPPEMQSQPENWIEEGTGGDQVHDGSFVDKDKQWEGIQ